MQKPSYILSAVVGMLAVLTSYLLLWPVPVDPVAWSAPVDRGLVDLYAHDDRLRFARQMALGDHQGPEDLATPGDGFIYASTVGGAIVRFRRNGSDLELFADVGGRPLGIEFDADGNLLVANAYLGLQRVTPDGRIDTLVAEHAGQAIVYANNVTVARDGTIYFSESSHKFGARQFGGTYEASLLDILEHGGHGRVFRVDADTGQSTVVMDGLNFANGVAISDDQQFLLVSETASYRIWRHWLAGARAGESEVILENLPAFPDNINRGLQGRFWIGLVAPRVAMLDDMSDKPMLRKIAQRLPEFARPRAVPSTHAIAITGDGQVLMNLQDPAARLPSVTAVLETRRALYLATLFGSSIARLDKRDLQPF